jgi:hypothetical protein
VKAKASDSGTVTGLITARYSQCAQEGETLAGYLTTGHPTSYDPDWGDYRQYALSLSGQRQALFVRQQADSVIEKCDTYETNQAQTRAAQAKAPACTAVGGTVISPSAHETQSACTNIAYISDDGGSTSYGSVSMTSTGTLIGPLDGAYSGGYSATEQQCSSGDYYGEPGPTGTWNAALGACLPSSS